MIRPCRTWWPAPAAMVLACAATVGGGAGGCGADRIPATTRGIAPDTTPASPSAPPNAGDFSPPPQYVLVGPGGATAWPEPPRASGDRPSGGIAVAAGSGFVVTGERVAGAERFLRLHDGRWLRSAEVTRVQPSVFAGAALTWGETLRFGWVTAARAVVSAAPALNSGMVASWPRLARVSLTAPCARGWCPVSGGWMRETDLAMPTSAPGGLPPGIGPGDAWLDVDLATQVLVAYRGDRPVYASLVSTGVGDPGSPWATPTGLFAIRSKHDLVRMDNLEHTGVVPYVYDVPLAQYFTAGKALHAAPWHHNFGRAVSHGCINLAPRDAAWVFAFTRAAATSRGSASSGVATPLRIRGQLRAAGGGTAAAIWRGRQEPVNHHARTLEPPTQEQHHGQRR